MKRMRTKRPAEQIRPSYADDLAAMRSRFLGVYSTVAAAASSGVDAETLWRMSASQAVRAIQSCGFPDPYAVRRAALKYGHFRR